MLSQVNIHDVDIMSGDSSILFDLRMAFIEKIQIKLNIQQCYPEGLINDWIRKGKKNDRTELLGSKHQGKNPVILFHICIPIIQRIRT